MQGFPSGSVIKNPPAMQEVLGQEDPLEEEMGTQSSILAWKIPWTEELGGLQSLGSQRVRHNWSDFAHTAMKYLKTDTSIILLDIMLYTLDKL